jgi:WD40 repeat protein
MVAVAKGEEALARQLAAQAESLKRQRSTLPLSTLLSVESMRRFPSFEADQALRDNLALLPRLVGESRVADTESYRALMSGDGRTAAWVGPRHVHIWDVNSRKQTASIETFEPVDAVAISGDGARIAASVKFGKFGLRVFDAAGVMLTPKPLPQADVLAWSPDNRYLASAGESPVTTIWDTTTLTAIPLVHKGVSKDLSGAVRAVVFSPDGKLVAIARRDVIGVWQVADWSQLDEVTHDGGVVLGLAFSPDSAQLAAASNVGQAQVWRLAGMSTVARFVIPAARYFQMATLRFAPNSRFIAVAVSAEGGVWELGPAPVMRVTMRHDDLIRVIAFSPDSSHVAAEGGNAASVYDVATGREVGRMPHPASVVGLGFVGGGQQLATFDSDSTARVWELEGFRRRALVPLDGALTRATFTRRGEAIISGDRFNRYVRVVDLRAARAIGGVYESAVESGEQLVVAQLTATGLLVRDVRSQKDLATLEHADLPRKTVKKGRTSETEGLVWAELSPNGLYLLAFITASTKPQLWDVRTARQIELPPTASVFGRDRDYQDAAFSPDGSLLALRTSRDEVHVYSLPEGGDVARLDARSSGRELGFSPDGVYLAVLDEGPVWSVGRRQPRTFTPIAADGNIAFAPSGPMLAYGSTVWRRPHEALLKLDSTPDRFMFNPQGTLLATQERRTVTVWDVTRPRQLAQLAHSESGGSVAFSYDGKHVATTNGAFVRVWTVDGREMARIEHGADVAGVAFSPSGDLMSLARLTPNSSHALQLLPWTPEQLITEACARLTRNLDPAEWRQYLGSEQYRNTCGR